MSIALLIILMLSDQMKYDEFHQDKNNIYRVLVSRNNVMNLYATVPFPLGEELEKQDHLIKSKVRLYRGIEGEAKTPDFQTTVNGFFYLRPLLT